MSNGYDLFTNIVNGNKFLTDATGAFRGIILACVDNGSSGIAVRGSSGTLRGEPFGYYTDRDGIVRHVKNISRDYSRNALDYIERKYAF